MLLGYVFWIIVSITLGASITGESSASITLATVLAILATLVISTGVQRFLGKARAEENSEIFSATSKFALSFTLLATLVSSVFVFFLKDPLVHVFGISPNMILMIIVASIFYALGVTLRASIISESRTRILIVILIVSSVVRFGTIIPAYFLPFGPEEITLSYLSFYVCSTALTLYFTRKIFFKKTLHAQLIKKREILVASISGWIPNAVYVVGTQTAPLFILSAAGATQAGLYFIAYSIFSAISALPMSLLTLAYPVMSGMKDGEETLLWQSIRIGLFSVVPVAAAITANSASILSLFGKEFISAQFILPLLIISLVPVEINRGITNLVYAAGKYKQVLLLGIFPSLARLICYFTLVPVYGMSGAAIAFLIGSVIGLIVAIGLVLRNHYKFPTAEILLISAIPGALATIFYFANVHPLLSCVCIIIGSYLALARLKVVTYHETEGVIKSIFIQPGRISKQLLLVARTIFGDGAK